MVVATEAEALLAEQNVHQALQAALQHPPARRQVLSVHRDLAGRAASRASTSRASATAASAPTSGRTRTPRRCAARSTCCRRCSCSAPARGRAGPSQRLAVPGLLHQALRGALRRLRLRGRLPRRDRRRDRLPVRPLPPDRARPRGADEPPRPRPRSSSRPRCSATACARCARCSSASGSPTRRSARWTRSPSRSRAPTRTRRCSRSATACSPTASRFYLANEAERGEAEVLDEFVLQYYGTAMAIPPQVVVPREPPARPRARRGAGAAARRPGRGAPGGARRQAPDRRAGRAQRAARARPGAPEGRAPPPAPRRGARRAPARARAGRRADADRGLRHLQPRRHAHGGLDGRVRGRRAEEVGLPPLHDPDRRGLGRLRVDGGGALAPARPVGAPERTSRRTTASTTRASPRCPTSS